MTSCALAMAGLLCAPSVVRVIGIRSEYLGYEGDFSNRCRLSI